jgi:hypothetical protein
MQSVYPRPTDRNGNIEDAIDDAIEAQRRLASLRAMARTPEERAAVEQMIAPLVTHQAETLRRELEIHAAQDRVEDSLERGDRAAAKRELDRVLTLTDEYRHRAAEGPRRVRDEQRRFDRGRRPIPRLARPRRGLHLRRQVRRQTPRRAAAAKRSTADPDGSSSDPPSRRSVRALDLPLHEVAQFIDEARAIERGVRLDVERGLLTVEQAREIFALVDKARLLLDAIGGAA